MADYSCVYTLSTGGGTIAFNQGTLGSGSLDNLYWISVIHGLDGPSIRAPIDDVPFGDGGIVHRFWKGPRHIGLEGSLVIQEVPFGSICQEFLNELEADLNTALDSILQTNGTLSWTPTGGSATSIPVRYEVPLDIQPTENYALRSFSFGLVSEDADPT